MCFSSWNQRGNLTISISLWRFRNSSSARHARILLLPPTVWNPRLLNLNQQFFSSSKLKVNSTETNCLWVFPFLRLSPIYQDTWGGGRKRRQQKQRFPVSSLLRYETGGHAPHIRFPYSGGEKTEISLGFPPIILLQMRTCSHPWLMRLFCLKLCWILGKERKRPKKKILGGPNMPSNRLGRWQKPNLFYHHFPRSRVCQVTIYPTTMNPFLLSCHAKKNFFPGTNLFEGGREKHVRSLTSKKTFWNNNRSEREPPTQNT